MVLVVLQFKVTSLPAFAVGGFVFTVTVTPSMPEQPVAVLVFVTVYVVVDNGFAVGLAAVASLNPVVGDHEYVNPLTAASPICAPVELLLQVFVKSAPAEAVGASDEPTVLSLVVVQPFASLIIKVCLPAERLL